MYKKNKVNLKSIKKIMSGKELRRKSDRREYVEDLMSKTTSKIGKQQTRIDKDNKTRKKLWREKQKNVFY